MTLLPLYMKRNSSFHRSVKSVNVHVWNRDIVCLPCNNSSSSIPYPRGKYRAELGSMGLIGKIRLSSDMDEGDVRSEIRSVFKFAMGHDPNFPFVFLQSTGDGCKTLVIPAQSSNFQRNGQQVARLGGQKNTVYILAQADMPAIKACLVRDYYYCLKLAVCIVCHNYGYH